jgi:heme/copper-type cytochrome/quinol oxidase subunit 2
MARIAKTTKMSKTAKTKSSYPFEYTGNIVILVLCIFIFFPVALVLALKNVRVVKENKIQSLAYRGSYGWLIFWTIVFFPIAIILLLVKGVDLVEWES